MAKKRSKAYRRLTAQRKPTERLTKTQEPYAVADAMWHALMRAITTREGN